MITHLKTVEKADLVEFDAKLLKELDSDYGAADDVTAEDIQFPIISLQHATSKKVVDGSSKPGSIFHYGLNKVMPSPMNFIPLKFFKFWRLEDHRGNIKSQRPWQLNDVVNYQRNDGFREVEVLIYYILTEDDLKVGSSLPARFSFRKTSLKVGKGIATQLHLFKSLGVTPWKHFFKMTTKLITKGDNSFFVPEITVDTSTKVPVAQAIAAMNWGKNMQLIGFVKTLEKDILTNQEDDHQEDETLVVTSADADYKGF